MNKKLLTLLIILIMTMTSVPVAAAGNSIEFLHDGAATESVQTPVIYDGTITVTDEGGKFEVGFVSLEFRKDFLDGDKLPVTSYIKISVEDGKAGIEISPSTNDFEKTVHLKVEQYEGVLYDGTQGRNVSVDIKRQTIKAEHFSWYRFR